jgi:hypothetical protein
MKNLLFVFLCLISTIVLSQSIPLPEHPRPDFERLDWINLNGSWEFEFDSLNVGEAKNWQSGKTSFTKKIVVPFPWGSPLSGIKDDADIAWYKKQFNLPSEFRAKRTFLTIGASDWHTTVWLNGKLLGTHQGGYTPFSFELTDALVNSDNQTLVVKVDDKRRDFTLYGKQGYGNARGIWQTVYIEARGNQFLDYFRFTPDIDQNLVIFEGEFGEILKNDDNFSIEITSPDGVLTSNSKINKGTKTTSIKIPVPNPRLWTLEDPYLYEVMIKTSSEVIKSYFGMRKISVVNLPGTSIPYISLNNKPIYLQLTLDQSYHPEGFYTFPDDAFMKNEIQLCKDIGLNGLRTHIKVDIPRKLYWADKLGLLVMADLPNFWGEPTPEAQQESEYTLRQMIKRDYNHPAIFSWIVFNETWGLRTNVKNEQTGKNDSKYLPKTQFWVASMYYLAKSLDESRLVEDNSICCGAGHTETDINSWHEYLPGYEWEKYMANLDKNTFPGSNFNFEKGFIQGNQPMLNSECGNVWGYEGSTGDVDWSYDYHRMMNVFRKYPKMSGWLYTEHHDVINEWNGYWRFDRSMKYTGLDQLSPGMTDRDFHSLVYITTGQDITKTVSANEEVEVPIFVSVMDDITVTDNAFQLEYSLEGVDNLGNFQKISSSSIHLPFKPWMQQNFEPLKIKMPSSNGLYNLNLVLKDKTNGKIYHRNFMSFDVRNGQLPTNTTVLSKNPNEYENSKWSFKSWDAMDGLKSNGAGSGHTTYVFEGNIKKAKSAYILMELGAKELFVKDREGSEIKNTDYMLGARAEPSQNKNSYPMTDEDKFSSEVEILINGKSSRKIKLEDDPADHRGILSWHYQKQNRRLDEAGSYGYLVKVPISKSQLSQLTKTGKIAIQLKVVNEGGLAIYGDKFGRYPFNPSIVITH